MTVIIGLITSRERTFMRIVLSLNFNANKWKPNQFPAVVWRSRICNLLDYLPGVFLKGGGATPPRDHSCRLEIGLGGAVPVPEVKGKKDIITLSMKMGVEV